MIHGRPYESGADINLAYVDVFRSKNPLTMLHTKFTGETLEEKYVEYRFIAWFSITIFNSYLFDYISKIEKNNSKKDNKDKKKK
ncbi:MAG: hypothetical protein FJW56_01065 [Actinobacteria bacterium]|nr:hypothetical protein [Actinomycetota bacterium]